MPNRKRELPYRLGLRWINNPNKIYYFNFGNMARLKKVLFSEKWEGKYEWGAIYENNNMIEQFKYETGWQGI